MTLLGAAVVLIGALLLVNLALTLAVIRWIRNQPVAAPREARAELVPPGTKAPEFTATTVAGDSRSLSALLGGRSVIAFFAPGCPPCRSQLPQFADFARAFPGGPARVLAVVSGEGEAAVAEYADALAGAASVVVEPRLGPVATAFSNSMFPAYYLLDEDGRIEASAPAMHLVPSLERA